MIKIEVDYDDVWLRSIDNESILRLHMAKDSMPTGELIIRFNSPTELIELAKEILAVCQEE